MTGDASAGASTDPDEDTDYAVMLDTLDTAIEEARR